MFKNDAIVLLLAVKETAHIAAIKHAFEAHGRPVTIQVVGTLQEYREAVVARMPNIALVDLNLPDGSAMEILTAPPESGPFPVLIMTSHSTEELAVQAINSGALDYFVKSPEAFAEMPHIVGRALREWKLRLAHQRSEAALRESHEIFHLFMENSPIYVFFKDANIRSLLLSRNYEQLLGRPLSELLGKNMDELFPSEFAKRMIEDDKRVIAEGKTVVFEEEFNGRFFTTIKFPICHKDAPSYLAGYTIDVTERHLAEKALREKNAELEVALAKVKALSGLLPICSGCKKIRDDKGYWRQVESYIQNHSEATFTHGLCPDCIERYFPGMERAPGTDIH